MIALEKFTEVDFERLISWIKNEEELVQFAGDYFKYPLTSQALHTYINQSNRIPLRVKDLTSRQIIGHCELNYQFEVPRLSRILIGDADFRNRGLGKLIVKEMLTELYKDKQSDQVDLYVYDWNVSAISCYSRVGFVMAKEGDVDIEVQGKTWRSLKMTINRERFEMKLSDL